MAAPPTQVFRKEDVTEAIYSKLEQLPRFQAIIQSGNLTENKKQLIKGLIENSRNVYLEIAPGTLLHSYRFFTTPGTPRASAQLDHSAGLMANHFFERLRNQIDAIVNPRNGHIGGRKTRRNKRKLRKDKSRKHKSRKH
jgi:hypothetical protein